MPRRSDANQAAIVAVLRACGATVQDLHAVGKGCPDLLVGLRGVNYLVEVKNGDLPPSAQKLTPDEARWMATWRGQYVILRGKDEAVAWLKTLTTGTRISRPSRTG